jgi:hypothetical protein
MKLNREAFFASLFFSPSEAQKTGINFLLDRVEEDARWLRVEHVAYLLATTYHETDKAMRPVEERGSRGYLSKYYTNARLRLGLGNDELKDAWIYKGRGYVHITGQGNYEKFAKLLKLPLVEHPELALDPLTAYRIATIGMFRGLFTGVGLSRYTSPTAFDYVGARAIINGKDKAQVIARYALGFEKAIRAALRVQIAEATPNPTSEPDGEAESVLEQLPDVSASSAVSTVGPRLLALFTKVGAWVAAGEVLKLSLLVLAIIILAIVIHHYWGWIKPNALKLLRKFYL